MAVTFRARACQEIPWEECLLSLDNVRNLSRTWGSVPRLPQVQKWGSGGSRRWGLGPAWASHMEGELRLHRGQPCEGRRQVPTLVGVCWKVRGTCKVVRLRGEEQDKPQP